MGIEQKSLQPQQIFSGLNKISSARKTKYFVNVDKTAVESLIRMKYLASIRIDFAPYSGLQEILNRREKLITDMDGIAARVSNISYKQQRLDKSLKEIGKCTPALRGEYEVLGSQYRELDEVSRKNDLKLRKINLILDRILNTEAVGTPAGYVKLTGDGKEILQKMNENPTKVDQSATIEEFEQKIKPAPKKLALAGSGVARASYPCDNADDD